MTRARTTTPGSIAFVAGIGRLRVVMCNAEAMVTFEIGYSVAAPNVFPGLIAFKGCIAG